MAKKKVQKEEVKALDVKIGKFGQPESKTKFGQTVGVKYSGGVDIKPRMHR